MNETTHTERLRRRRVGAAPNIAVRGGGSIPPSRHHVSDELVPGEPK
jgi:hypothetical protein